jgi:DNA-binding transcriptional LysR family regulator
MVWDDIRYFLELHRAGSLARAGARLGVDPTTVGRRIQTLERSAGRELVRRARAGIRLTEAGRALLRSAEEAERALRPFAELDGAGRAGSVRLTMMDGTLLSVMPALASLRAKHPEIELQLIVSSRPLDLSAREADVALRGGRPLQDDLFGRRVAVFEMGLYAAPGYLARCGTPNSDFRGHDVIVPFDELEPGARATDLRRVFAGARIACRTNSTLAVLMAAEAGLGLAVMPVPVGEASSALVRVGRRVFAKRDAWLLAHKGMRKNPRVAAVFRHLVEYGRKAWSMK